MERSNEFFDGVGLQDQIRVEVAWRNRSAVISVCGTIDLATATTMEQAINNVLDAAPDAVVIDLSDVDFFASAGMTILVGAQKRLQRSQQLGIVARPITARPLTLVGLADVLPIYPTLAAALKAERDNG
ncbi:STAS domain-containing protein [Skermania sp. ID1734]|uniref:STAS domain-containing protein n=1 Tax=Skermania sp. ID1734 TaxID=2597516 RepID=UPI00163DC5D2|nr:STAS domain-containing protein [Skermania sp. ID1734]